MELRRTVLVFCFPFIFLLPSSISLDLTCSREEVIFVHDKLDFKFGPYGNNQKCNWIFKTLPENELELNIHTMEVEMNGANNCYDYLFIAQNASQRICRPINSTIVKSMNISLSFYSDSSNVYNGFRGSVKSSCFIKGGVNPWMSYTLPQNYEKRNIERRKIFEDSTINANSLKEYFTLGHDVGKSFCPVREPISEIPSCTTSSLTTCGWEPPQQITELSTLKSLGFLVTIPQAEFKTKNSNLQLENVCLAVEYKGPVTEFTLTVLYDDELIKLNVTTIQLVQQAGQIYAVRKMLADMPHFLKRQPVQLRIGVNSPVKSNSHIRNIAGCTYNNNVLYYSTTMDNGEELKKIYVDSPIERVSGSNKCQNGGLLVGSNCLCPIGFGGEHCEKGCGPNKYGPACEAECALFSMKCYGKIFCKKGFGCDCATGYKGSECITECSPGSYGAGCRQKCGKCRNSEPCDIYTGECISGCVPGYIEPFCKNIYAHVSNLRASKINYTSAILEATLTSNLSTSNENYIFYSAQYREVNSTTWKFGNTIGSRDKVENILTEVIGLSPGKDYEARVLLFTDNAESYQGDGVAIVTFTTLCKANPLNITAKGITSVSATISWTGTSIDVNRCQKHKYVLQLSSFTRFQWKSYSIHGSSITLESLVPDTVYIIRIKPEDGSMYYYSSFTTYPEVSGRVKGLGVTDVTSNSITIGWKMVQDWESFVISYECTMVLADENLHCSDDRGTMEIKANRAIINGLKPFRQYRIKVRHVPGLKHSEITVLTKSAAPGVAPILKNVRTTNTTFTVEWLPPVNCLLCNGIVNGYYYTLVDTEGKLKANGTEKWIPNSIGTVVSIDNLIPNSNYTFSLLILNDAGSNKSAQLLIPIKTRSVPFKLKKFEAYKTSRKMIGLRWQQEDKDSEVDSFSITIDDGKSQRTVHRVPTHCSAWPEYYCTTITSLIQNTEYTFTIRGVSDKLTDPGPPCVVSANTTEKIPEAPLYIKVVKSKETSLTLEWRPPRFFNGNLRSFLIKMEEVDTYNPANCCENYPKIEVEITEEKEWYAADVTGLGMGSTYAVSVMAETAWVGPAAVVTTCTRPPPPPPPPAPIGVGDAFDHGWLLDYKNLSDNNSTGAFLANILLVKPEAADWSVSSGIIDPDLKNVLSENVGPRFCYVGQPKEGMKISLEAGGLTGVMKTDSDWGKICKVPWESGKKYIIVLASVSKYCELHSVSFSKSDVFVF